MKNLLTFLMIAFMANCVQAQTVIAEFHSCAGCETFTINADGSATATLAAPDDFVKFNFTMVGMTCPPCSESFVNVTTSYDGGNSTTDDDAWQDDPIYGAGLFATNGGAYFNSPEGVLVTFEGSFESCVTQFSHVVFPVVTVSVPSFLPVELTDFTARAVDNEVHLEWETSMEINNDFFAVEHSADGSNFRTIGEVSGNGTTDEYQRYGFTHANPSAGKNYYRLKQTDFDGKTQNSNVIIVRKDNEVTISDAFPNPIKSTTTISLISPSRDVAEISIVDMMGKTISFSSFNIIEGQNSIVVDMNDLPEGIYFISTKTDSTVMTQQVVKN